MEPGAYEGVGVQITLLVAAEGDYNLPAIYDNNDLKEALKKLGSIPADNIQVGFQGRLGTVFSLGVFLEGTLFRLDVQAQSRLQLTTSQ